MSEYFPLHLFHSLLLAWYKKYGRALVWRETLTFIPSVSVESETLRNPYYVLVAEMMLQQTQVSTVIPKYTNFLKQWPTIEALSKASLSEVIIAWKGLGYNRRAKHLLETSKIVMHAHDGTFPEDAMVLSSFPGLGPYMVQAIRVFAFGKQEEMIDVNVARVLSRVESRALGERFGIAELREVAKQSVPKGKADDWHQALMDFGATICTAKSPKCDQCPVSRICRANKQAKDQGFISYALWLSKQPKVKASSGKDAGKKFEETDRYFRGRIIDYLRDGEQSMVDLQDHILRIHKLENRVRFGAIIESLVTDGLVAVRENRISLKN